MADEDWVLNDGVTAVMLASKNAHLSLLLLEFEADNDWVMHESLTALKAASLGGHLEVVRLLLESGAGKDFAENHAWTLLWRHPKMLTLKSRDCC